VLRLSCLSVCPPLFRRSFCEIEAVFLFLVSVGTDLTLRANMAQKKMAPVEEVLQSEVKLNLSKVVGM
jgi:hypothetical protein